MSTYKQIFNTFKVNPMTYYRQSLGWYQNQIKGIRKPRPSAVMRNAPKQDRTGVSIGSMYFFYYDAKLKDTLPIWDMFPLVIPFTILSDGFIGLNFHYLPYGGRIYLLDTLLAISQQSLDDVKKLRLTWDLVKTVAYKTSANDTVHRYLSGHVRSAYKKVEPEDWKIALALPVEKFTSYNYGKWLHPKKVW